MELLEWDARTYDSLPLPHRRWGAAAIARLALAGDETVLDLGCGTGRDAELLLGLLPHGHVIALDGSEQMLSELRKRLASQLHRITVLQADFRQPVTLPRSADAVLSVATLHWLPDHSEVFRSVAAALRPGGRFVAEAGGAGNLATFRAALRAVSGADGSELWNFADIAETAGRLEDAGFTDIDVRLVADPARLQRGEQLEAFIATVLLAAQLRDLPDKERRPFVHSVAERLPDPVIDYVRLQISARRG
ncbi:class I SAM-dependent methyltransferase [Rhodococcus daqingensis]|uniref:Class I SAM-dependent methyltransferase n=1 Tax=Rhodococcus daqingensis TaxID=2479363 RepID=A0ABW2RV77_9NOCA